MKRDLKLERVYPRPPERVWRALTDRRALSQWLMETDFEPTLGHRFTFRARPQPGWDGITYCEVIELDPPRRLAYTWRGGPGKDRPLTLDTVVRFTLTPEGSGTRLILEHTGFSGLKSVLVSFMMKAGWNKMLRTSLDAVIAGLA
ncbi:MAG TPA: SRPBCC domain-containing protein [Kofleriaceae bacterium]|jgi:uncharacterized protein YndB with AHSA1/START domain|nr:SRPBCC domain-containing protein [Kofleriaceae bacterium]